MTEEVTQEVRVESAKRLNERREEIQNQIDDVAYNGVGTAIPKRMTGAEAESFIDLALSYVRTEPGAIIAHDTLTDNDEPSIRNYIVYDETALSYRMWSYLSTEHTPSKFGQWVFEYVTRDEAVEWMQETLDKTVRPSVGATEVPIEARVDALILYERDPFDNTT